MLAGFRLARARHRQGFPCCVRFPARACCRQYPGGDDRPFSFAPHGAVPVAGSLPRDLGGSASALTFSRPARRSLALRPARSLSRPRRPFFTGVLQSISLPPRTAPIATGWNEQVAGRVYPPLGCGALARRTGSCCLGQVLAQVLNVRFFEAAEQHAEASATRPWAKPVGCKQPTGTATALTRRGAAAARKHCEADAYIIARSLGGLCPTEPPRFSLGMSWPRWKRRPVRLGRAGGCPANRTSRTCRKADI